MPQTPHFRYFLYHKSNPIIKGEEQWNSPIPMDRSSFTEEQTNHSNHHTLTHGDYFLAVSQFLEKDGFSVLITGISRRIGHSVDKNDLSIVDIYLEKHGEFYHPSRVETTVHDQKLCFVINVAVSQTGRLIIKREFEILKRLNRQYPDSYIPP